jgi:L-ascorbate metabolism protein UlaG (beta-lactamase superfamily)
MPFAGKLAVVLLAWFVVAILAEKIALAAPGYKGPKTDHFDGDSFPKHQHIGGASIFKWFLTRKPGPWKVHKNEKPGPPPPRRVTGDRLVATFIGHSTVLIQMDGINILTDPIWSDRASPVSFAGPRRVRPPAIRFEDLPPIDVVLLSHNHYDHLDLPTLRRLAERDKPLIVTTLGVGLLLKKKGIGPFVELDWWQGADLPNGKRVIAVPVKHFSGRSLGDRSQTLWAGFVVEGSGGKVLFAGDTAYGPFFREIRERMGAPRLAILPIGAYRPPEIMAPVHMNPPEAILAFKDLGAREGMAIHFGTFPVADDGEEEGVNWLRQELACEEGLADKFRIPGFGEGRSVP